MRCLIGKPQLVEARLIGAGNPFCFVVNGNIFLVCDDNRRDVHGKRLEVQEGWITVLDTHNGRLDDISPNTGVYRLRQVGDCQFLPDLPGAQP